MISMYEENMKNCNKYGTRKLQLCQLLSPPDTENTSGTHRHVHDRSVNKDVHKTVFYGRCLASRTRLGLGATTLETSWCCDHACHRIVQLVEEYQSHKAQHYSEVQDSSPQNAEDTGWSIVSDCGTTTFTTKEAGPHAHVAGTLENSGILQEDNSGA